MSIELQLSQRQILSQNMVQSVRILQMTTQEVQSYVDELALENPAMDVESPGQPSIDASVPLPEYIRAEQQPDSDESEDKWNFSTDQGETLIEHLHSQLDWRAYSPDEVAILRYLLESLDECGYLTEDASFVAELFHTNTSVPERLIRELQSLDPPGVCAHDLKECLRIQLQRSGQMDDTTDRILDSECRELVARGKYAAIATRLNISAAEAAHCCAKIRALNPRPGSRFYRREVTQYTIADVFVSDESGHYRVVINDADMPTVSVNAYYQRLFRETQDTELRDYLEQKLCQAEWLRQCIAQRRNTILRVTEEILRRQKAFFSQGPDALCPMSMDEVAEALDLHISTVSRCVSRKYLQCKHGVFPLGDFFQRRAARSISSESGSGGITGTQVKNLLAQIITGEPPEKPFSDRILSEKLAEHGVAISRRTVAKYREEAGIPDASGRKKQS